jgi:WD40 repeat protein
MAFSPDARWFLTSSSDGFLRIWEVNTGRLSRVIFVGGRGGEIAFTPGGEDFFIASGTIRLLHFEDGSLIASFGSPAGGADRLALSPDGKTLATLSQQGEAGNSIISVYDVSGASPNLLYMPNGPVKSLAISPDSQHLAVNTSSGQVQVLELATGNPLLAMQRQFPTPESVCSVDYTSNLSFSPDGKTLALSFCSEYINLFDSASGDLQAVLAPGGLLVGKTAFSPDGRLLAIATHDGTELRSTADWSVTVRLKKPNVCEVCNEDVKIIALSPDGKLLAAAVSGKVEIWRLEDGALIVECG